MDSNDKYTGRILDNRYEILELIGSGGMAYVYKALCHRLNRLVAIKILKEDLAIDEEFQQLFYTESQAIAMLSHPNIVAVYDVSRSGTTEYIVMELIEGITLKQYISRKGLLNWKEALHFGTQITKALTHAHSRGIIHRDIKPHNIMILKDGSVKVADFGIARLLTVQNTLSQDALGSVHYISPEQAKGSQIDARSDIYSVGVVMYEMLTSRLPFVGDTAVSVAIQHISAIPLQPRDINPDIPIGIEEITMHAMEPDVNTRFTTADEMLADLEEFRKNPAIIFNYSMSDPADRVSADSEVPYRTRMIPKDAIAAPNRSVLPIVSSRPKTDLSSSEYRDAKRRSRSTATLLGILAVIIVVIVAAVIIINMLRSDFGFDTPEEMITVPDFRDRRYEEVVIDLEYRGIFTFEAEYINSSEKPEGIVISQRPEPDTQRRMPLEGNEINVRLYVSMGDEAPMEMPNLRSIHYVEAKNRLLTLQLGLEINLQPIETEETEDGLVIETIPGYGEPLPRGSIVLIRYAKPKEEVAVMIPNLVGMSREIVQEQFDRLEVIVDWREYHNENEPEDIVTFIQGAGTSVQAGSTIQIFVSLGPEPTPEPTPTPEPDPTETDEPDTTGEDDPHSGPDD